MRRARRALLALLGLTLLRTPIALLVNALLPSVTDAPEINYAVSLLQSLLLFALPGWLLRPRQKAPAWRGREWLGWGALSVSAALCARTVVTPLNRCWSGWLRAEVTPLTMPEGLPSQLLMILALAVVPAVAEELFFRGALLTSLMQSGAQTQAVALTTLMFALMHGSLAGMPGHLLTSLLLTLLMLHTGRLAVPVTVHLVYNLSALFGPETAMLLPWFCGAALLALILWLSLRQEWRGKAKLQPGDGWLSAAILLLMGAQYLL